MSTVLALDHGSRRIGVAVGDTETGIAFARPALRRRPGTPDVDEAAALVATEGADLVLVGLPLNMDGSEGRQAASARAFAAGLARRGIAVALEDERLSSWAAEEELRAAGRQPERRSGDVDSAAARLILQQYFDARRRAEPPEEAL